MSRKILLIEAGEAGTRLDKWLAGRFPGNSRERWKGRIIDGSVTVNGLAAAPSSLLAAGDQVELDLSGQDEAPGLLVQPLPLRVLYEDDWLAVLDKPAGLVVHPAPGHPSGTLVNAILALYPDRLSDRGGEDRPGIVHRLDKDSSGALLIARDNQTHKRLADLFKKGEIDRFYEAIVRGRPDASQGLIDAPIARGDVNRKKMFVREDGKEAKTEFEVLAAFKGNAHLRCRLISGRTHQIRVHLAYIGHPVIGDRLYGGRPRPGDPDQQLLHASALVFRHPVTGVLIDCHSPLPDRFKPFLEKGEA